MKKIMIALALAGVSTAAVAEEGNLETILQECLVTNAQRIGQGNATDAATLLKAAQGSCEVEYEGIMRIAKGVQFVRGGSVEEHLDKIKTSVEGKALETIILKRSKF